MQFELSPVQLITICAILNGFVFAFLLFEKRENRQANRFLSLMIFSMCLTFTPYMLDPSVWHKFRWLAWMPFSLSYWIGPSFYFYIRALTGSKIYFEKKDLWHFSPIILNYLHSIYHAIVGESNPWPWFHHVAELFESFSILSVLIYLVVSFKLVKTYRQSLYDNVSNTDRVDLRWVKQIIVVVAVACLLILIFLAVSSAMSGKYNLDKWDDSRALILLMYAGILYWFSISGFKQAQTHKMAQSTISEPKVEGKPSEIVQKLQESIESLKLFTNPELSLSDLSRSINISERSISDAINQELGKNFFQFINEYRVEEVKSLLQDPKNDHFKIISLALDAGFNSKATFNRIFKTYTGHTPKDFKATNR